MRVLIIGTARSGTSQLQRAFKEINKFKRYGEPWNKNLRVHGEHNLTMFPYPYKFEDNCIVKTLVGQYPHEIKNNEMEFYKTLVSEFDHTILLGRRDNEERLLSWTYQVEQLNKPKFIKQPWDWHIPYWIDRKVNVDKFRDELEIESKLLIDVSNFVGIDITWYEDLYSGNDTKVNEVISKWSTSTIIDINKLKQFIDPKLRYRQFGKKKNI